jgi:hypothetical protein
MPKKTKPHDSIPFCLRLTFEERAQLEHDAAGKPLGTYIRSKLLSESRPRKQFRKKRAPVKDQQSLGKLLAALGQSHIANNLNQLAKAAHSGSLLVTPETEHAIKESYSHIQWMREALIDALGLRQEESE